MNGEKGLIAGMIVAVLFVTLIAGIGVNRINMTYQTFFGESQEGIIYDYSEDLGLVKIDMTPPSGAQQTIYVASSYKPGEKIEATLSAEGVDTAKISRISVTVQDPSGNTVLTNSYSANIRGNTAYAIMSFNAPSKAGTYKIFYKAISKSNAVVKQESKTFTVSGGAPITKVKVTLSIPNPEKALVGFAALDACKKDTTLSICKYTAEKEQARLNELQKQYNMVIAQSKTDAIRTVDSSEYIKTTCAKSPTRSECLTFCKIDSKYEWCGKGLTIIKSSVPVVSSERTPQPTVTTTSYTSPQCTGAVATWIAGIFSKTHCGTTTTASQSEIVKTTLPDNKLNQYLADTIKIIDNLPEDKLDLTSLQRCLNNPKLPECAESKSDPVVQSFCAKDICLSGDKTALPQLNGQVQVKTCYSHDSSCNPAKKSEEIVLFCNAGYIYPGTDGVVGPWNPESPVKCAKSGGVVVPPSNDCPRYAPCREGEVSVSLGRDKDGCELYGPCEKVVGPVVDTKCQINPSLPECQSVIPCANYQVVKDGSCVFDLNNFTTNYMTYILVGIVVIFMLAMMFVFVMMQRQQS